ncbi:MAG: NTP transferase domain-containing protein [Dehalococcoidales bacterium]|nr:NTP transferase domain-containing protein [Dehalococcoidales bacterium]
MQKSVVSVLLTCGGAERFPFASDTKYKALLPLNGRPVVDYVAEALCNSKIEKVFVIQCREAELEKNLRNRNKITYIFCDKGYPSLADSLYCAIRGLLDYYGEDNLHSKYIMFVPCDIPAVNPKDFDALISQITDNDTDFYTAFIERKLLRVFLPKRRFRSMYFRDIGGHFSQQGINVVNGRLFSFDGDKDGFKNIAVYGHDKQKLSGLSEIINDFRNSRHTIFSLLVFISGFLIKRLIRKGGIGLTLRLACGWLSGKLTQPLMQQALYRSLNIKVGLIKSRSVAFSADIDKPADFGDVERLMQQFNLPASSA